MLFLIAVPLALQNLISFGLSVTDSLMLSQLGSEIYVAAASQANQPLFVFDLFIFGIAGGGSVLTSQYWGKGDLESVRIITGFVVRIAIIVGFLVSLITGLFPEQILGLYLEDQETIKAGSDYLRIVSLGCAFRSTMVTFGILLRSVEVVKISVIASAIAFVTNIVLNWTLIFGNLGFNAYGISGAAMATLISRVLEFSIVITYLVFFDKRLKFKLNYLFKKNKQLFGDYIKYSSPVVINELAWSLAITCQAAIIGKLSVKMVSSVAIATVFMQLMSIATLGVANASSIIVGKKIGEGNITEARLNAKSLMRMSVFLGSFTFMVIIMFRGVFLKMYDKLPSNIVEQTYNLLIITAIIALFSAISCVGIMGVLRGAGDIKYALIVEMVALWGVAIPLGLLSGFVFKLPIFVTYFLLKIDEPLKSIFIFIRTRKKDIYKNLTIKNDD